MNYADWEQMLACYPAVLTIDEVAAVVRVHPRSVHRWVRAGQLAALRVGRGYRIAKADVLAWITAAQLPPNDAPGSFADAHSGAAAPLIPPEQNASVFASADHGSLIQSPVNPEGVRS